MGAGRLLVRAHQGCPPRTGGTTELYDGDEPVIELAATCGRYSRGHDVRWTPAGNSVRDSRPGPPFQVLSIQDGVIAVSVGAELRSDWNHDPDSLAQVLDLYGPEVGISDQWGILRISYEGGGSLFSIAV